MASSVNITNITIQWDRVDCLQRNGPINSYRLAYYPTADSSDHTDVPLIIGTSDRMYTAVGLLPNTSYAFELDAFNFRSVRISPQITITVSTSVPQGEWLDCNYKY